MGCSECVHHKDNCTTNFGPERGFILANCLQMYCGIYCKLAVLIEQYLRGKTHCLSLVQIYICVYIHTSAQAICEKVYFLNFLDLS